MDPSVIKGIQIDMLYIKDEIRDQQQILPYYVLQTNKVSSVKTIARSIKLK